MNALPELRIEIELEPPWLQPIVLPAAAYLEFARNLSASLAELESRFAPAGPRAPVTRIVNRADRDQRS